MLNPRARIVLATVLLSIGALQWSAEGSVKRDVLRPAPPDYHAKWAVIIGVNDYSTGKGFGQLNFAANDAREFRQLLVDEFGYDDSHIHYLADLDPGSRSVDNGRPTLSAIRTSLEIWLPQCGLQPDDSVLFFFAGHGLRDGEAGEAYIAAANSNANEPKNTCLRVGWVRDLLADKKMLPCRHKLILLDCCFSGGLFRFDLPLTSGPAVVSGNNPKAVARGGGATQPTVRSNTVNLNAGRKEITHYLEEEAYLGMTAGLGDEPVSDGTGADRHSLFTKALLQAMYERANSPREGHVFTFSEMAAMIRPRVAEAIAKGDTRISQIPMAGRLAAGDGDFVFRETRYRETPWEKAARDERRATAERFAGLAGQISDDLSERRTLLAFEAFMSRLPSDAPNASAESALRRAVEPIGGDALLGHNAPLAEVRFVHSTHMVLGTTTANQLYLWDPSASDRQDFLTASLPVASRSITVSPGGDRAATVSHDGEVLVWNMSSPNPFAHPLRLPDRMSERAVLSFSPDGSHLVAALPAMTSPMVGFGGVRIREGPVRATISDLQNNATTPASTISVDFKPGRVRFSPGGQLLISGGDNYFHDEVSLLDVDKPGEIWTLPLTDDVTGMQVLVTSHSGRWMITKEGRYMPPLEVMRLWDLHTRQSFVLQNSKDAATTGDLDSAHISDDEKWVATGTRHSQTIWRIDSVNGFPPVPKQLPAQRPPEIPESSYSDDIRIIGITPDSRWLMTDGMYNAKLWDLKSNDPTSKPKTLAPDPGGHWSRTDHVLLSDRFVVDGKRNGTIELWDIGADVPKKRVLTGHEGWVDALAQSDDGRWLVSKAGGIARLWDLSSPEPSNRSILAQVPSQNHFVISADKRWLAYVGTDASVGLGRLAEGDPAAHFERESTRFGKATAVAISSDSLRAAWGVQSKGVVIANLTPKHPLQELLLYPFSPDYRHVSNEDVVDEKNEITRLCFSDDGRWLAAVDAHGITQVWNVGPQQPVRAAQILRTTITHADSDKTEEPIATFDEDVLFCPGSSYLICRKFGQNTHLYALTRSGKIEKPKVLSHSQAVLRSWVSPDGRWLLVSMVEFGQQAVIYDLAAQNPESTKTVFGDADERIWQALFSRDGEWLVTLGKDPTHRERVLHNDIIIRNDKHVRLWKVPKHGGTWISASLAGHSSEIMDLSFTPDDHSLLTLGADRLIRRWDLKTAFTEPAKCEVYSGARAAINEFAISPDSRWLAAVDGTRECLVWSLKDPTTAQRPFRLFTETPSSTIYFVGRGLLMGPDFIITGNLLWRSFGGDWPRAPVSLSRAGFNFWDKYSVATDKFALLYHDGTIERFMLDSNDLLSAARHSAGRNFTIGESQAQFPDLDYKITFPDLPVHQSYESTNARMIWEHVENANRQAMRGNLMNCLDEYDAGLERALTLSQGNLCSQFAETALLVGMVTKAVAAAEHAASLAPADAEAVDLLALCYAMSGQRDRAVQAFTDSKRLGTESRFSGLRAKFLNRLMSTKDPQEQRASVTELADVCFWPPGPNARLLIVRALYLASQEKPVEARDAITAAVFWARESHDVSTCNEVCWVGSLYGYAEDVVVAGETAWEQSRNIDYLDTLAVARALSGKRLQAIDDFKKVVDILEVFQDDNRREFMRKRVHWLDELREGRNPFDDATLRELRGGQ